MCMLMVLTAFTDTISIVALADLARIQYNTDNIVNIASLSNIAYQLGYLLGTFGGGIVVEVRRTNVLINKQ
jgi:hypothetical protein